MDKKQKTIFALSTPPGKSAIGVIRLSGDDCYNTIKSISTNMPKKQNISSYNNILSSSGEIIDQTITTYYKAPKSFTGEDMVEISSHGSEAVIKKIFETLASNKQLRIAKQGEFTRRAFENNKLDLTQVEAISDVIHAETEMQRKQALSHLSGHFFKETKEIFESLKAVLANIEAVIDFTEEDLPENLIKDIKEQIKNNNKKINQMLKNSSIGISIRGGFLVTIMGKPNTGKSSFINQVSGRDLAIVTNEPGTTRDFIESFVDIDGLPIKFVDTAGIRDSLNTVEKIGVEKAKMLSKESHINIVFIEKKEDILTFNYIKNSIFVRSKQDILGGNFIDSGFYNISSKSNYGIDKVLQLIRKKIYGKNQEEKMYISRERHVSCLQEVVKHLENSKIDKNIDIFAEDIRLAIKNFSFLFGNVDIEEILDIIFSDFCIGK